ncbi:hypothetical protein Cs7R123_51890 [Catellatospora sp. TT07R-123]|uniref:hypothetical protein n=1 Tax=Catellatospora sp. TT07R-123 TaxID=2733863 RepID=UPI001B026A3F|nr:hypothetical protein [Catellatospora sp. TT07R-123]GHJ47847.1 hypothetical protein Cs7R123_51890 [Catellatospora sp. TT07R-123]
MTEASAPQAPAPQAPPALSTGARIARVVGLAGHLLLSVWYAASGLLAPGWAVAVLMVVWAALFIASIRWWRTRPWWVLAVPVAALAFWLGLLTAGEAWLGWTA